MEHLTREEIDLLQRAVTTEIQTLRHGPSPERESVQVTLTALRVLLDKLRAELTLNVQ